MPFNYVITFCDHANDVCPVSPATARKLHHDFPDPAKATGTEEQILTQFRLVRDQVKAYARNFVRQEFAGSA